MVMDTESYDQYMAHKSLQQDMANTQTSLAAPQIRMQQEEQRAILVEQTDPKRAIREVLLTLANIEENTETGELVQLGDPLMNKAGIDMARIFLRGIVHQHTTLSNLDEKFIDKLIVKLNDDLTDDLSLNWKEYGIKQKTHLDIISDLLLINAYNALRRAANQNEKNFLKGITIETVSSNPYNPKQKKGGFLEKLGLR